MDLDDGAILKDIDPAELGGRIRAARVARGWTQTELAGDLVSVGYVSRLESGQRRPNAAVLEGLAERLGLAIDELLRGPSAREHDAIRLQLDYAELSLENGDALEAESQARGAIDRADAACLTELSVRGHFLVARALEAQGTIDDAILELEPLVQRGNFGLQWVAAAIALSRCYREEGDLSKAIETAERVLTELEGSPLDSADEAVQLAVTLAAAYYERGDVGHAVRTCRRAIDKAERLSSSSARAAAYWNASIMEADRGHVGDAVPLAERALALLAEGKDGRNLARLRTELADMQLQLDPPELHSAQQQLSLAAQELAASSAGAIDFARNNLSRAKALLLEGDVERARILAVDVHGAAAERAPILAADAKTVEGQAFAATGRMDEATQCYRAAVLRMTGVGADREAAQLWFELAGLLEGVGELETAIDAYRSAAASTGLRGRTGVRSRREIRA